MRLEVFLVAENKVSIAVANKSDDYVPRPARFRFRIGDSEWRSNSMSTANMRVI